MTDDLSRRRRTVLVVDDTERNLQVVGTALSSAGYEVVLANSAEQSDRRIAAQLPDLILLDVMMPGTDGLTYCAKLKSQVSTADIPVIFLSAADEERTIVRAIEAGGVDYVTKPFNKAELLARTATHLQLRDAQQRADALLLNILPQSIAARLKAGEHNIVDRVPSATVVFVDVVRFSGIAASMKAVDVVAWLESGFLEMDELAARHGLLKIKTIGDAYMAAAGLVEPVDDHAARVLRFACDTIATVHGRTIYENGPPFSLRIGVHSGEVVAGVIGQQTIAYDVWGETVNLAYRMEAYGEEGRIHVGASTRRLIDDAGDEFTFHQRAPIGVKGIDGPIQTFFCEKAP